MAVLQELSGTEADLQAEAIFASYEPEPDSDQPYDEVKAAMGIALRDHFSCSEVFRNLMRNYVAQEPIGNVAYRNRHVTACIQALVLDPQTRGQFGYPHTFPVINSWRNVLEGKLSDSGSSSFQEAERLLAMAYQKNKVSRAGIMAVAAAGLIITERLHDAPVYHEWGAAANLVLNGLARRDFGQVTFVGNDGGVDKLATNDYGILAKTTLFKKGIGIEKQPPQSAADDLFIKSCTLNPNRLGTDYEQRYDSIAAVQHPDVSMIKADFFKLPARARRSLERNNANVSSLSFVGGQIASNFDRLIATMIPFVDCDGRILVTDYMDISPDNPQKMQLRDQWDSQPWLCKTALLYPAHPERGMKVVLEWQNGDCEVARPGRDFDHLGLTGKQPR